MVRWRNGQDIYDKLIANLAESVSNHNDLFNIGESSIITYARSCVPEFINTLRVGEINLIHEFLMYRTEVRKDLRTPVYEYSGGDRITSVTRYIQKNIELELAKQYA
jgi:hypothetical protein